MRSTYLFTTPFSLPSPTLLLCRSKIQPPKDFEHFRLVDNYSILGNLENAKGTHMVFVQKNDNKSESRKTQQIVKMKYK